MVTPRVKGLLFNLALGNGVGVFSAEILKSLMKEGGLKVEYNIKKLEKELLSNIDTTSQKELEKVNRYINLIRIYYELDKSIEVDGAVVVTENGSQKFTKTNPAIQEKIESTLHYYLLNVLLYSKAKMIIKMVVT